MLNKLNRKIKVNLPKVVISRTEKHIELKRMLIFIVVMSAVGTYILLRSFAATSVVAILEAEDVSLPTGAQIISDTAASGGKAVKVSQNTTFTTTLSIPSAVSSLAVTARSDQCSGSPTVAISVDKAAVLPATAVSTAGYAQYTADYGLAAGTHTINITVSNAGTVTKGKSKHSCTQTLYLDAVTFYGTGVAAAPTVSLSANSTMVAAGTAPSLNWTSSNASSCAASGGWSGSKATAGSETQPAITAATTYKLACTGSGGTTSVSTTINVTSANISVVPASIAADCSVDVTAALLNWIGSVPNNYTLAFASGKCYRIDGTIELRGRSGLTFEGNGAAFKSLAPMTSGKTTDDQRAMFRVIGSTGFVFRDMAVTGAYTHGGSLDNSLQHAHGFDLRGTSAEIANTTISNVAGDCVYFGLGYDNVTRSTGSYHDSTCTGTGRNGVSVTAGDNILVQRVTTSTIGYDVFDVEPNLTAGNWGSQNVKFDSNTIGTYYLSAYSIVENGPISNQSFTNNKFTGRGLKITAGPASSVVSRPNNVTIQNNTSTIAQAPAAMNLDNIDNLIVTGNTVSMTGGTMAAVNSSCKVSVSGNNYSGGTQEVSVTNPVTSCQ